MLKYTFSRILEAVGLQFKGVLVLLFLKLQQEIHRHFLMEDDIYFTAAKQWKCWAVNILSLSYFIVEMHFSNLL